MAKPDGALSELSFDSDEVTGERGTSHVACGDPESACSVPGIAIITCCPADTSSGADFTAHGPSDRPRGVEQHGRDRVWLERKVVALPFAYRRPDFVAVVLLVAPAVARLAEQVADAWS